MKYVYPAVFTQEGHSYSVIFPDLEGCYTCGDDLKDALYMAEDVLAFTLFDYEKNERPAPEPSEIGSIKLSAGEFVNYIVCDTIEYQRQHNNKAIKKTLLQYRNGSMNLLLHGGSISHRYCRTP